MQRDELTEQIADLIATKRNVHTWSSRDVADAVLPLIEADLRERLAEEIEAERARLNRPSTWCQDYESGMDAAARIVRGASADTDPTMPRSECRCPDDCDCDGRFSCGERAGLTERFCELVVGHTGAHVAGNHRWTADTDPAPGNDDGEGR